MLKCVLWCDESIFLTCLSKSQEWCNLNVPVPAGMKRNKGMMWIIHMGFRIINMDAHRFISGLSHHKIHWKGL